MEYGSFRAEEFGDLQRLVDGLFYDRHAIDRLDLIVQAEILDLAPDLMEIVNLLPPGYYDRSHSATSSTPPWPPTAGAPSTERWNKPRGRRFGPLPDLGEACFRACGQKRANMSTVTFLVAAIFGRNRQNST